MNIYSSKSINTISIIITIIIFIFLNLLIKNFSKTEAMEKNEEEKIVTEKISEEEKDEPKIQKESKNYNWYIEIPSIKLKAPIEESTEMNVLNTALGHFEETPLTLGNIGLAGHNRGYEKNYFQNLKEVKLGDIIQYKYNDFEKIYVIDTIQIIKSTNWDYLENTEENKITLITCIENEPNYRRCVQATEKE